MATTNTTWHTGETVKELAARSNISANALSMRLGISYATMYNRFGQAEWPTDLVYLASQIFGVRHEWLSTGKGEQLSDNDIFSVNNPSVERILSTYREDAHRLLIATVQAIARVFEEDMARLAETGKLPVAAMREARAETTKAPAKKTGAKAAKKRKR
jgi:hypothetical protein